jgi:hypothetical protein
MRHTLGWWLTAALSSSFLYGCSDGSGPTAGVLVLSLQSPDADNGAVLLTLAGGPVDSVEAPGLAVYNSRSDVNTLRVILTGPLPQGPIARVHIPDTRVESGYTVSVQQIAALGGYTQRDPAAVSVSLSP